MHDARYLFRCHRPRTVRDVYSACNSSTTLWNPGEAGMPNMHDKSLTIIQENSASHQGHHLLHDKSFTIPGPRRKVHGTFFFSGARWLMPGSTTSCTHQGQTLTPAILALEGNNNSKAACPTWLKNILIILRQLLELPMFISSFSTKSVSNAYYTLISDF